MRREVLKGNRGGNPSLFKEICRWGVNREASSLTYKIVVIRGVKRGEAPL